MIEEHISPEMSNLFKAVSEAGGDMAKVDASAFPVLNMLNTRYLFSPTGWKDYAYTKSLYFR